MKKREVKSQKQEQNGHKKGARNKRGGRSIANSHSGGTLGDLDGDADYG
jgi:hypothetical protein